MAKAPGEGRVDIDLPGIHIHAAGKDGDKDSGEVKIGRGISIGLAIQWSQIVTAATAAGSTSMRTTKAQVEDS